MINGISGFNSFSIQQTQEQKGYYKEIYNKSDPLRNATANQETRKKMVDKLQSFKEEIKIDDSEQEKFRKTYYNSIYNFFSKQALDTKDGESFKIGTFGFTQSGFSKDGRVTIWGKYLGYDKSMSNEEVAQLRKFIDSNKVKIIGFEGSVSLDTNNISLLDSADISIEEFKEKYIKVQEELAETYSGLSKYKQGTEDNGKISQKKFKPIQATSKTKTYNINDDEKFKFSQQLLKLEQSKGIDVLKLMETLEKKQKGVDIKV